MHYKAVLFFRLSSANYFLCFVFSDWFCRNLRQCDDDNVNSKVRLSFLFVSTLLYFNTTLHYFNNLIIVSSILDKTNEASFSLTNLYYAFEAKNDGKIGMMN